MFRGDKVLSSKWDYFFQLLREIKNLKINELFKKINKETKIRFVSEFIIKLVSFLIIPIITYNIGIQEYGKYIVITLL